MSAGADRRARASRFARRLVLGILAAGVACLGEGGGPLASFSGRLGGLDTRRVVALGDGFPAGAQDGALYRSGQERSLPALFARQVAAEGFVQPLVADPGFGIEQEEGGRLVLARAFPPLLERLPRGGPPLDPELERPYSNLAVPGALLEEALVTESAATSVGGNPFYDLVLRGRGTAVEQAAELEPSLALLWIGTSDVLVYARAGGDPALAPGLPTAITRFRNLYADLVDRLLETTAEVVLFNVPDVTAFPFLTTVPPIVIDPETGEPVTITVVDVVIDPETGDTLTVRREETVPLLGPGGPLEPGDRVLLGAAPLLAEGDGIPLQQGGTGAPLPNRLVMSLGEQALARDAVAGYNQVIEEIAATRELAVVDVHAFVEALRDGGIVSDGVRLGDEFLVGQAFSLDGAFFSPKGYGALTNLLIDAVNDRYGSRLPHVRTADLPGVPLSD